MVMVCDMLLYDCSNYVYASYSAVGGHKKPSQVMSVQRGSWFTQVEGEKSYQQGIGRSCMIVVYLLEADDQILTE